MPAYYKKEGISTTEKSFLNLFCLVDTRYITTSNNCLYIYYFNIILFVVSCMRMDIVSICLLLDIHGYGNTYTVYYYMLLLYIYVSYCCSTFGCMCTKN